MKKAVVERSVAADMANKNLKVDSDVVKWEGVENLWEGLCSSISLFFHLNNNSNVELHGFGFNALNIFWVLRRHILVKNQRISKKK